MNYNEIDPNKIIALITTIISLITAIISLYIATSKRSQKNKKKMKNLNIIYLKYEDQPKGLFLLQKCKLFVANL